MPILWHIQQESSPYLCLWQAYTCHLTESMNFHGFLLYLSLPTLQLPLLPLHSPFPHFIPLLPSPFFLPTFPLHFSFFFPLFISPPFLSPLLSSLLSLIGNLDWSRSKLELKEEKKEYKLVRDDFT